MVMIFLRSFKTVQDLHHFLTFWIHFFKLWVYCIGAHINLGANCEILHCESQMPGDLPWIEKAQYNSTMHVCAGMTNVLQN